MSVAIYAVGMVFRLALLFLFWRAMPEYLRFPGVRLVTCPETRGAAVVHVDALHAGATGAVFGTRLRLESCSRWPERQDCGRDCVAEIEEAPRELFGPKHFDQVVQGTIVLLLR